MEEDKALVADNLRIRGKVSWHQLELIWPMISAKQPKFRHTHKTKQPWCPYCWGLRGSSPAQLRFSSESVKVVIPAGFLRYVETAAFVRKNVRRPRHNPKVPMVDSQTELRPYQSLAVLKASVAGRGLIISPTGSGKTLIALSLINQLSPAEGYILVPTREIMGVFLEQSEKHFDGGFVQEGGTGPGIHVMTYAAWNKKKVRRADLILVDECHHAGARDLYKSLMSCDAYWRFGFTATPTRSDHRWPWVVGALGPIVAHITDEVVDDYVADVRVFMHLFPSIVADQAKTLPELSLAVARDAELIDYLCNLIDIDREKAGLKPRRTGYNK